MINDHHRFALTSLWSCFSAIAWHMHRYSIQILPFIKIQSDVICIRVEDLGRYVGWLKNFIDSK